jgi:hypothetical protein
MENSNITTTDQEHIQEYRDTLNKEFIRIQRENFE